MRVMIIAYLCVTMLVGCAGVSTVAYERGDGSWVVQRTLSDPHAFAPSHSRSWLEVCKERYELPGEDVYPEAVREHEYKHCERDGQIQFATTSGYLDGLGAAALYSGAIVGGAALIGNGIAQSGSTMTQTGGGATQNQLQGQGQMQLQLQKGFIPPGHAK